MSWMYSRWTAPSDRDYDDDNLVPPHVVVTCVACRTLFEVEYDERPPYRCPACCERDAEEAQRDADRRIA